MRKRGASSFTACECGDHVFAPLTLGFTTLVSPEDAHLLSAWWQAKAGHSGVYACRRMGKNGSKQNVYLHREILRPEPSQAVDHRNNDTLDNRRSNVRLASVSDNNANRRLRKRDLPRGVYRMTDGAFCSVIRRGGKQHYLGRYRDPEEAHAAYCAAAAALHGEFARFD